MTRTELRAGLDRARSARTHHISCTCLTQLAEVHALGLRGSDAAVRCVMDVVPKQDGRLVCRR